MGDLTAVQAGQEASVTNATRLDYLRHLCVARAPDTNTVMSSTPLAQLLLDLKSGRRQVHDGEDNFTCVFAQEIQHSKALLSSKAEKIKEAIHWLKTQSNEALALQGDYTKRVLRIDALADDVVALERFAQDHSLALSSLAMLYEEIQGDPSATSWQLLVMKDHGDRGGLTKACSAEEALHRLVYHMITQDVNLDSLLWELSCLYVGIRHNLLNRGGIPSEWVPSDEFCRSTVKYWVHPSHIAPVKAMILKNLPLFIHGQRDPLSLDSSMMGPDCSEPQVTYPVTSVYYDNDTMDTYHCRLRREDGGRLVRVRWYGAASREDNKLMYVERKTHREPWTGERSMKERAALQPQEVPLFLSGALPPSLLRGIAPGKVPLLTEIHEFLTSCHQSPCLRTTYNRTAFQDYDTCHVRISLDQDLVITRETCHPGEAALPHASNMEVVRFPYAILEIKLEDRDHVPQWVEDLKNSYMLVEVRGFSKFLHGSALLDPSKVQELPWWVVSDGQGHMMPEAIDRLREVVQTEQAPSSMAKARVTRDSEGRGESQGLPLTSQSPRQTPFQAEEGTGHVCVNLDGLVSASQSTDINLEESKKIKRGWRVKMPVMVLLKGRAKAKEKCEASKSLTGASNPAAPTRVAMATRVDPKTFFAAERTFLQWLNISVLIMLTGLSLLGGSAIMGAEAGNCSGGLVCRAVRVAGLIISPVSVMFMIYALWRYKKRTAHILKREAVRYDDQKGPTVMTITLIGVTLISIALAVWTLVVEV